EWILNEEEKEYRRQQIEENRKWRESNRKLKETNADKDIQLSDTSNTESNDSLLSISDTNILSDEEISQYIMQIENFSINDDIGGNDEDSGQQELVIQVIPKLMNNFSQLNDIECNRLKELVHSSVLGIKEKIPFPKTTSYAYKSIYEVLEFMPILLFNSDVPNIKHNDAVM
ncbi:unnamed protein product, partial [Oppiella nova]